MDGYLLNVKRPDALPIDERVRCVMTFEANRYANVEGFAAFSGLDEFEAGELAVQGGTTDIAYTAPLPGLPLPFDPANPDSIKGLKNRLCKANTVIAEYLGWNADRWLHLQTWPGVQGASWTDLGLLLVEFGADEGWPVVYPGEVRADYVTAVRDVRALWNDVDNGDVSDADMARMGVWLEVTA